jgi:[protein-PII] uridylyltransferase
MSDLGILGAYIPEWADLVAFFQHNVYHYYTADEHTLIALANAERLRVERGPLHEVFRMLGRKDLLYLAILLHDIAKPRGVADHEITGVEMSRTILRRLGMEEDSGEIGFLIRHHLAMEQVAFRRNLHDPATIREFAALFDRPERLSYLYVLTYADLSAVNPSVWTAWKATMLLDLYQLTLEVLVRNLRGEQIDRFHRERAEAAVEQVVESLSVSIPREDIERHLEGFQNDAYVATFSEREIREHIERSRAGGVSVLFERAGGLTEVTVIAPDAPYALSRCCAVLAANDASIIDANIFTRDDGILIDRFRIAAPAGPGALGVETCRKIDEDLQRVLAGTLDIEHLLQEHRRRWRRRPRPPVNPNIRTDVKFEETPRHTIIDVYAPDSLGFLYRVTEAISSLGMDIYFAKIATRVDGIVDAFYVLDRDGKKISDPARQETIRSEILALLARLAKEELGRGSAQGARK